MFTARLLAAGKAEYDVGSRDPGYCKRTAACLIFTVISGFIFIESNGYVGVLCDLFAENLRC